MKQLLLVAIFAVLLTSIARADPAPTSPYVNDFAGLVPAEEEAALARDLALMRRETGIQFTVVIIDEMAAYGHQGPIAPFAKQLFDQWGIGDEGRNDGAMMLIAVGDRQMRIELGASYGARLDVAAEEAVQGAVLPHFRRGNFVKGIYTGADAISLTLTDVHLSEHGARPDGHRDEEISRSAGPEPWWFAAAAFLGGIVFMWRRRKKCPSCGALRLSRRRERTIELHVQKTATCGSCNYELRTIIKHGQTFTERRGPGESGFTASSHGGSGGGASSGFGGGSSGGGASGDW